MTMHNNAYIKDPFPPEGMIVLNGSTGDYVDTPASSDFDFGSGDFTVDMWVDAVQFPPVTGMATILAQSDVNGSPGSMGGAGLRLVGDKLYYFGSIGGTVYSPANQNTIHSGDLQTNT